MFKVEKTEKTPEIIGDNDSLTIKGISIPEDGVEFYKGMFNWLDDYLANSNRPLKLEVFLTYSNTVTSHVLRRICVLLRDSTKDNGVAHIVEWQIEEDDIDMEEAGLDFKEAYPLLDIRIVSK